MEGRRIFYLFTLVLAIVNSCITLTKFRVNMVPQASYNEVLDVPQDILEDYNENEYPINPVHAGKYLIREKHFPYIDDLVFDEDTPLRVEPQITTNNDALNEVLLKKSMNKKRLTTLSNYQLSKVKMHSYVDVTFTIYLFLEPNDVIPPTN